MKPSTTVEFLDALKARYHLKSDYALAKFLQTNTQNISRYRKGWTFDAEISLKVAGLLELPVGYVLACIEEERAAKRPEIKAAWRKVADALAPTATGTHQKRRDSVYYVKSRHTHPPRAQIVAPRGSQAVFAFQRPSRHGFCLILPQNGRFPCTSTAPPGRAFRSTATL